MVNWQDPTLITQQFADLIKLHHALGGLYIWEVITSLPFDWRLVSRREKHPRNLFVKWIYLGCRYSALASIVTSFAGYSVTKEINCKVWVVFVYLWSFLAAELASTLIAIRAVVIWNRDKTVSFIIVSLFAIAVLTQLAFFIDALTGADAKWIPTEKTCLVLGTTTSRANVTVTLCINLLMLFLMLVGLLKRRETRRVGLWQAFWTQGLLWVALATIAEVPTTIFLYLNLNTPMNLMFFSQESLFLVIGATRMYRTLLDFINSYDPSGCDASAIESNPMTRIRAERRAADTGTGVLKANGQRTFEEYCPDGDSLGRPKADVGIEIQDVHYDSTISSPSDFMIRAV